MIGGCVFWEPSESTPIVSALGALVTTSASPAAASSVVKGAGGLFAWTPPDVLDAADQIAVAGDLDLTNLPELAKLADVGDDQGKILSALYMMEGPQFVRRLRGAFALAVWDARRRILCLAVDHFGIKRLYYVTDHGRTAFASRPHPLVRTSHVEGRIDPTVVYTYLNFGYVPAPASIFLGVKRLSPGHHLVVQAGRPSLEAYWDMTYREQRVSKPAAAARIYELTSAAVSTMMRGSQGKNVGAFLSGGTDSSTVVGLMSRTTDLPVNAFSIGFREERYDELHYAELAARHFGAAHYTRRVTPEEAFQILPDLVDAYDEPFANNSAIGTFFCAKLARDCGVTQLLAGDGGDEIFGGNERYRTDRIFGAYHLIPPSIRTGLLESTLLRLPERGPKLLTRAQRYVRRARIPNPDRFYSYEFFFAREGRRLLAPDFASTAPADVPYAVLRTHYGTVSPTAELNRLLYLDLKLTIGDNDLLKVTRTADLAGVRVRFPMLDLSLVEFMGTLPASYKVRWLEKRHLFKRAFRPLLPAQTLAKAKHGFGVPTSVWLKSHGDFQALSRDTLLSRRTLQRGYFQPGAMEELFREHANDSTPYYGDFLWNALMLELWHRRHVDGRATA